MEEIKKDTAQKSQTEELKEKYGKVYRVGATIEVDDETEKNVEFFFKRPSTASYDRYVTNDAVFDTQNVHQGHKRGGVA